MTELVRPVKAERIPEEGLEVRIVADATECAAVAVRLLLPAIASLDCRWALHREPKGAIRAEGVLQAEITQECVVSLEPFAASVAEIFTVRFVVAGRESQSDDPDEPDELTYDGATLDIGEAAVEQLALALPLYPRKPGAILPEELAPEPQSAFAALAKPPRPA